MCIRDRPNTVSRNKETATQSSNSSTTKETTTQVTISNNNNNNKENTKPSASSNDDSYSNVDWDKVGEAVSYTHLYFIFSFN